MGAIILKMKRLKSRIVRIDDQTIIIKIIDLTSVRECRHGIMNLDRNNHQRPLRLFKLIEITWRYVEHRSEQFIRIGADDFA